MSALPNPPSPARGGHHGHGLMIGKGAFHQHRRVGRVVVSQEPAERFPHLLDQVQVLPHEPNVTELDGFAAEVEAADRYPES